MPLWDPERCPHVLRLTALGSLSPAEFSATSVTSLHPSREILFADGAIHIAYGHGDRSMQICIRPVAAKGAPRLVVEFPSNASHAAAWLSALARFSRLRQTGEVDTGTPPDPRGQRLFMTMRALDGSLAGRSQREIAGLLFGSEQAEADWRHPGQHLRDRVRRAVGRGRALMGGGYLELLR